MRFSEEVLEIKDVFRMANGAMQARTNEKLNALQKRIIDGTWQQKSHAEIADREGLSVSHVSREGAMLFRGLSQELGKSISKKNMVEVFGKIVGKSVRTGSEIVRVPGHAEQFVESLENGVELKMVRIPAGVFMMGSPKEESEGCSDESPQHLVTVSEFYFGEYPVTQAQWRAVADLPQEERELKREPSNFKGGELPVEQVSWFETIECCRLLRFTAWLCICSDLPFKLAILVIFSDAGSTIVLILFFERGHRTVVVSICDPIRNDAEINECNQKRGERIDDAAFGEYRILK
jgi:hypothetical protein